MLFGGQWWDGWLLWFSSEFVNYMTIVPLVLSFPSLRRVDRDPKAVATLLRRSVVPTALLATCIIFEWVIGGAGAIAFAMPALVTAALLTNVFVTSVLTAASTAWTLVLTADGHLGLSSEGVSPVSASVQIDLLGILPRTFRCHTGKSARSHRAGEQPARRPGASRHFVDRGCRRFRRPR